MADTNCPVNIDVVDSSTIDFTILGAGTGSDPFSITGGAKISVTGNNAIQVLGDGLFVDACDMTDCLECISLNGTEIVTSPGDCADVRINDQNGSPWPVTPGSPPYVSIPRYIVRDPGAWPSISCAPSVEGNPVYQDGGSSLYTEPLPFHRSFEPLYSSPTSAPEYLSNGLIFGDNSITVANPSICSERFASGLMIYSWRSFSVRLPANTALNVVMESKMDISMSWIPRRSFYITNTSLTDNLEAVIPDMTFTETTTFPVNTTTTYQTRYRSLVGGGASGAGSAVYVWGAPWFVTPGVTMTILPPHSSINAFLTTNK